MWLYFVLSFESFLPPSWRSVLKQIFLVFFSFLFTLLKCYAGCSMIMMVMRDFWVLDLRGVSNCIKQCCVDRRIWDPHICKLGFRHQLIFFYSILWGITTTYNWEGLMFLCLLNLWPQNFCPKLTTGLDQIEPLS